MKLYGDDLISKDARPLKLLINETSAYLFPIEIQHRDAKQPGLWYQDDSAGNALAATITSGRIDIRHHSAFSDERVHLIVQQFSKLPQLQSAATQYEVYYQGRLIGRMPQL